MKKHICFITPPSSFLLDERVFISLGVLKVAAVCEFHNHITDVLDLSGVINYEDVVSAYIEQNSVEYIGITATTPQIVYVTKIINRIREVNKNIKIILGGPHPTLIYASIKKGRTRSANEFKRLTDLCDVFISGDGEKAILLAIEHGRTGVIDADDYKTDLFLTNDDFENGLFPARHLINMVSYSYSIDGVNATSLIAQLGCPYRCGFCGGRESNMLRRIRLRQPDSVIREVEHLYLTYGYTGFMFYDDELNVNKNLIKLMNDLADFQVKHNVEFKLRGFLKSELFTEEQAVALYKAGFRWLLIGFESGSPRILSNIQKIATKENNTRCMEIAKKYNLKVKALMSVGHPGESRDTIKETKEWLLEVKPDDFDITVINTYPGTPYYDHAIKNEEGVWEYKAPKTNDILYQVDLDYTKDLSYYKGDPNGGYTSFVYTEYLSREELVIERDALEAEVRAKLDIPYYTARPGIEFEHSMGQSSQIPKNILYK